MTGVSNGVVELQEPDWKQLFFTLAILVVSGQLDTAEDLIYAVISTPIVIARKNEN